MVLIRLIALFCVLLSHISAVHAQAYWNFKRYDAPVCNNPNCTMCNSIRAQLARNRQQAPVAYIRPAASPKLPPMSVITRKVSPQGSARSRKVSSQGLPNVPAEQELTEDPGQAPSTKATIDHALRLLKLSDTDVLVDFGCGDARVLIQAANQYGCRCIGVEIDPELAAKARKAIRKEYLTDQVRIITGDVLEFDPVAYGATAGFVYQFPELLNRLGAKFRQLVKVASPIHRVNGLPMAKHVDGDSVVFLFSREAVGYTYQPIGEPEFSTSFTEVRTEPIVQKTVAKPRKKMLFFTASWCGLCPQMKPVVQQLRQEGYDIEEVDADLNKHLVQMHGVTGLPAFVVGAKLETGLKSASTLKGMFQ